MMNRRVFQIRVVEGPTPCSWTWTPSPAVTRVDPGTESFPPLVLILPSKSISRCLAVVDAVEAAVWNGLLGALAGLGGWWRGLWAGLCRTDQRMALVLAARGKSSRAKKQFCIFNGLDLPTLPHSLLRACTAVLESFAPPKPFLRCHCSLPLLFKPHPPPELPLCLPPAIRPGGAPTENAPPSLPSLRLLPTSFASSPSRTRTSASPRM